MFYFTYLYMVSRSRTQSNGIVLFSSSFLAPSLTPIDPFPAWFFCHYQDRRGRPATINLPPERCASTSSAAVFTILYSSLALIWCQLHHYWTPLGKASQIHQSTTSAGKCTRTAGDLFFRGFHFCCYLLIKSLLGDHLFSSSSLLYLQRWLVHLLQLPLALFLPSHSSHCNGKVIGFL